MSSFSGVPSEPSRLRTESAVEGCLRLAADDSVDSRSRMSSGHDALFRRQHVDRVIAPTRGGRHTTQHDSCRAGWAPSSALARCVDSPSRSREADRAERHFVRHLIGN